MTPWSAFLIRYTAGAREGGRLVRVTIHVSVPDQGARFVSSHDMSSITVIVRP